MEELKAKARAEGLWNLFLPDPRARRRPDQPPVRAALRGHGAQPVPGSRGVQLLRRRTPATWSCCAVRHATSSRRRYLEPLLEGRIRSAFSMTEPAGRLLATPPTSRPGSRATATDYVIDGRKWFTSGAMSPRCELLIVMGVTDPDAERHRRQSMILVDPDTPGVDIRRSMHVLGYLDGPHGGHAEIVYDEVRVPATNLLGDEGEGFADRPGSPRPGPDPPRDAGDRRRRAGAVDDGGAHAPGGSPSASR